MENKQSAEEYQLFESLLKKHGYNNTFKAAQEYANQQNQELQNEIKNLKLKVSFATPISLGDVNIIELQRQVENNKITNNHLSHEYYLLQSDYTKLKEAADEMANELEGWDEHCDAISNYKQLTIKP